MPPLTDKLPPIRRAIMAFDATSLPEALADKLIDLRAQHSPIDMVVGVGELIYANRRAATPEALRLAAACAFFAHLHGMHFLAGERGGGVYQALMRDAGEPAPAGVSWPGLDADPEPLAGLDLDPPQPQLPPGAAAAAAAGGAG